MIFSRLSILLSIAWLARAKLYERCELARELRNFDVPETEIATWVCIAQHESNFNTSAVNAASGDHGLFQISEIYWCSPPGYGCNTRCANFRDEDISDDLRCIRIIYNEHTRISGDGFNAWVVYPLYCKGDNSEYVKDCFDKDKPPSVDNSNENEIVEEEKVDEYGDGYQFPPLPVVVGKDATGNLDKEENLSTQQVFTSSEIPMSNKEVESKSKVQLTTTTSEKSFYYQKVTTTISPPLSEPTTQTIHKNDITDHKENVSREDLTKFSTVYSGSNSTVKPSTTTFTQYNTTTTFVTPKPFKTPSTHTYLKSEFSKPPSTIISDLELKLSTQITTSKPFSFKPLSFLDPSVTPKPKKSKDLFGRQVTFAPGTFFNLQTLPPVLPPFRPSGTPRPPGQRPSPPRPGGQRPALGQRPQLGPRPPLRPPNRPTLGNRVGNNRPQRPKELESDEDGKYNPGIETSTIFPFGKGAPVLVSFPHLLYADRRYIQSVEGLEPNRSLHETYMILEPISGTPLQLAKRVQFNMFIRPIDNITALENVTQSLVPIFWIEESTQLPELYLDQIQYSLLRSIWILNVLRWTCVALALAVIAFIVILFAYAK